MRAITYAQLHDGFFIPGTKNGNWDKTLPPSNKSFTNFRMFETDNGSLLVQWDEGKFTKGFTIGAANVKIALHATSPIEEAKAEDKVTTSDAAEASSPKKKGIFGR